MKVYLAGPITGLSYDGAVDWRETFQREAEALERGIECKSPMRLKEHLSDVTEFSGVGYDTSADTIMDSRAVVGRDIWDVRTADVVLMNLAGAERISIGTMCELGFAAALNKLIITVMPPEERSERKPGNIPTDSPNPHDHLFVYELSSIIVPDLATALTVIDAL